jgi:hypothetical protein
MSDLGNEHSESKGAKKIQQLVRGSLLLMLGAWMATGTIRAIIYILRTQNFDSWFAGDTVVRIACSIFLIWVGARAVHHAGQELPRTKIGWGRLLLGVVFIYIQIRDYFVPAPDALQPDNANQAFGMRAMRAVFWIAGVALIFAAFLKKKPQANTLPEKADISSAQQQNSARGFSTPAPDHQSDHPGVPTRSTGAAN